MYYSQLHTGQDKFVVETFNSKLSGTFLDIGCNHFEVISNTYYLERNLNWRGVAIDIDATYESEWKTNRISPFIVGDATKIDYQKLLEMYNMPKIIDYLSLDIEPPQGTLAALFKVFESDFSFNVITYEVDSYRDPTTVEPSQRFLKDRGFNLVRQVSNIDDFYIHQRLM